MLHTLKLLVADKLARRQRWETNSSRNHHHTDSLFPSKICSSLVIEWTTVDGFVDCKIFDKKLLSNQIRKNIIILQLFWQTISCAWNWLFFCAVMTTMRSCKKTYVGAQIKGKMAMLNAPMKKQLLATMEAPLSPTNAIPNLRRSNAEGNYPEKAWNTEQRIQHVSKFCASIFKMLKSEEKKKERENRLFAYDFEITINDRLGNWLSDTQRLEIRTGDKFLVHSMRQWEDRSTHRWLIVWGRRNLWDKMRRRQIPHHTRKMDTPQFRQIQACRCPLTHPDSGDRGVGTPGGLDTNKYDNKEP